MSPIIEAAEQHAKSLTVIVGFLTLLIPKVQKVAISTCRRLKKWATASRNKEQDAFREEMRAHIALVRPVLDLVPINSERLEKIEYALYNNGKTGILNHVERLVSRDAMEFEYADWPGFECDSAGKNTRVTGAYRKLVGATRAEDLNGGMWRNVIVGPLVGAYVDGFKRASEAHEDYIGEVHFQNPLTGEARGLWRIYIHALPIVGNDIIFSGRFIAALDPVALQLAERHGWDMEH